MSLRPSAQEIANEVRMHAIAHQGFFLLVEGDGDERFYRSVFSLTNQHMVIAFGYERLVGAIAILDADNFQRALGIVDRDYHGIAIPHPATPNLAWTDDRDIEVMLFESSALDRAFEELGSVKKIANEVGGMAAIRDRVYAAAQSLNRLRLLSAKNAGQFSFRKIDFDKITNRKTLVVDEAKLLAHLRGISPEKNSTINNNDIAAAEAYYQTFIPNLARRRITRGHDLVSIAAIGLRSIWGNNSTGQMTGERLEACLRLAADKAAIRASQLGTAVIAWFQQRGLAV